MKLHVRILVSGNPAWSGRMLDLRTWSLPQIFPILLLLFFLTPNFFLSLFDPTTFDYYSHRRAFSSFFFFEISLCRRRIQSPQPTFSTPADSRSSRQTLFPTPGGLKKHLFFFFTPTPPLPQREFHYFCFFLPVAPKNKNFF